MQKAVGGNQRQSKLAARSVEGAFHLAVCDTIAIRCFYRALRDEMNLAGLRR